MIMAMVTVALQVLIAAVAVDDVAKVGEQVKSADERKLMKA